MTRQASICLTRRTDNVYSRQPVSWWHQLTYKIHSVAINNHVNHFAGNNIPLLVNSWSTAKIDFDLQY